MSNINKDAVLNPFSDLTANILNYLPRATTSKFGIVAIGSGINVDALGRIYLDTQEYSDRLAAIEAQAASSLSTQQTEVAAAIAQANLAQSQTITALTLEVNTLKTNLTNEITTTKTDLINRADQLAQDVTDITNQLTQDKAAFTQEIQDALVYLENAESVASALRTPRKINGVDFDGTQDITLPLASTSVSGTVQLNDTLTSTATDQALTAAQGKALNANKLDRTENAVSASKLQTARTIGGVSFDGTSNINLPGVNTAGNQNTSGNAATATKLQTVRAIGGVSFDGSANINLPGVNMPGNQSTSGNAGTATRLATARTISLTGAVIGSVSFDGSGNASITTTVDSTVSIAKGGTGATTASQARINLDVYSKSEVTTAIASATSQATETALGVAKIATTAIARAGINDTDFITPSKLRDYLNNKVLGINQTWQDVTASRYNATTYTNSSTAPIMLSIAVRNSGTVILYVNGAIAIRLEDLSGGSSGYIQIVAIVPAGGAYKLDASNNPITFWGELK